MDLLHCWQKGAFAGTWPTLDHKKNELKIPGYDLPANAVDSALLEKNCCAAAFVRTDHRQLGCVQQSEAADVGALRAQHDRCGGRPRPTAWGQFDISLVQSERLC